MPTGTPRLNLFRFYDSSLRWHYPNQVRSREQHPPLSPLLQAPLNLQFNFLCFLLCSQVGRGLLASSHAGTRLPIALIRPRRSPPSAAPLREMQSLPFKTKTGGNLSDASCKKSLSMTSYGGIIRIRLKGRSWMTSSQPAIRAPL